MTGTSSANSASSAKPASTGVVAISPKQLAQIDAALHTKSQDQAITQAIIEAAPVIKEYVRINACLTGYNGTFLNPFLAPGKSQASYLYMGAPMPQMRYHDKSTCVTVLRFGGWAMPARNALRFEVVYHAEDSGESLKSHHELVKQPSGEWLFSH